MPQYYDLQVALCDVTPRIWRRFLISSKATFADLHVAIQEACGWWNYHLYAFRRSPTWDPGEIIAGVPDDEFVPTPDAARVKLSSFFGTVDADTCYYLYDFGDDWWHEVTLRGTVTLKERFRRKLLGGARAFPHEDSGGLVGYEACVKAALYQDEGVDDPDGLRTWLGEWQPESLDLDVVKKAFDR